MLSVLHLYNRYEHKYSINCLFRVGLRFFINSAAPCILEDHHKFLLTGLSALIRKKYDDIHIAVY